MKKINDKLFINEDRVQYVEELNEEYFLITSFGSKISISKDIFDDLKDYEGGGTEVVANPDVSGETPTELVTLEIGGAKYQLPIPTDVIANPTLAGTEAELGSIQIGETKYKIGGGKQLYCHYMQIGGQGNQVRLNIVNDVSSAYTSVDQVTTYLYNAVLRDSSGFLASGYFSSSPVYGVYAPSSATSVMAVNYGNGNTGSFTASYIKDIVVAL